MSTEIAAPSGTPDVIGSSSGTDASTAAAPSPATDTATSSADVNTQSAVQGTESGASDDPLAGFPPDSELEAAVNGKVPWAEMAQRLKSVYTPLKSQFEEFQQKFSPYESALERFEQPEQLQQVLGLHDSLIGWESDPQTGEPIPSTQKGAQQLAEQYPQHADFLVADLLSMPTYDPQTGRQVPRIDYVLESLAADPEQKARALKILGGVEPSAVAPRWAPDESELAEIQGRISPALLDTYKALDPDQREDLRLSKDDTLNRVLENMKLTEDLKAERTETQRQQQEYQVQREEYVNNQALQAGNDYLNTQLNQALTTFHESVVQQCNFIKPLDPQNLPQGVSPEQATQMNQQISASNKAEAAQITGLIVSLFNPQTKAYVLPLLKEIGAVDDKMLGLLDNAASSFGNNSRNYGNLSFRQQLNANGQGYQPSPDVTQMNNEAQRALKTMIGYANQIRGKLMEKRSQFFELTAQQHNTTLNGSAAVRPPINGQGFNPTTAPAASLPTGRMTRAEIDALYG